MNTDLELDQNLAHLEYARALLSEKISDLKNQKNELLHEEDEFFTNKKTKKLSAFFFIHQMIIVSVNSGQRSKEFYPIAKHIWRQRETHIPFIKKLSRSLDADFNYETSNLNALEKTDLKNLLDELSKYKLLSYSVQKTHFAIKPLSKGQQRNFFTGGWAEEVTLYLIDKTLKDFSKAHPLKHKLFWDVKLKRFDSRKDNSHDMQLDLVVELEDRFYIFETKSGFILSIDKWVDRSRLFNDDKNLFITCAADENLNPRIFSPYPLFALPSLEKQFMGLLEQAFPKSDESGGNS